ncbi:MAG: site-specific integrase [Clostridia bacterium]|nr:site-specific integrase [Clostridia bacterium]
MTYKEWLSEWLELYVKPLKRRTYERYNDICNLHIISQLGDYELDELTPMILQKHVNEIKAHGNRKNGGALSANFVNAVITVIQASLKKAYEFGYTNIYHAGSIQRPKVEEGEVKCFTVKEQKAIEKAVLEAPKRKMLGVIIALYTGVRIGELLSLEFSAVDMQKRTIAIKTTCYESKDENGKYAKLTDTPKSHRTRVIPFPKQLLPIFKELKALSKSGYVIENAKGEQMSVRSYQRSFELLIDKLGISKLSFHALRHTFATRALESGMDVKTLSEVLGHKSATVTLNRYAHSMMEHKQSVMDRFGTLLTK